MSRSYRRARFVLLLLLVAGIWAAQIPTEVPDTILFNGRVFTATESRPYAEAIAIKGTRILAVDTNEKISSTAGRNTRRIDLAGHPVIPGINDVHTHFAADPQGTMVDFGSFEPACTKVLERLGQAVSEAPRGAVLFGIIGAVAFFDPACTPAALDRIAPQNAVVLGTWTGHAAMLNQAAARKFDVRPNDPPPLGGFFGKDMKGKKWDGVVHEGAWSRIEQTLTRDRAEEQAKLRRHLNREAQWGVTSITIMEVEPARRVELLSAIDPPIRVRLVPFLTLRRMKAEYPTIPAPLSDRVEVSGVKRLLDGTPIERSAAMRLAYADDPSVSGQMDFSPQEIRTALEEAQKRNLQPLFHVAGDRTAEAVLNEIEATGGTEAWSHRRLRIEHGDGLMPDLIPRAKKLGVIVVQNPAHLTVGELLQHRLGPERAAVFQPLRSLLEAGIPLVLASDSGPGVPVLNPYLNIMIAANVPGKPQESLTREEALTAYTRTAAYAEFAEKDKGTLESGKFADLAVLSQDIFKIPPQDLPKTESLLTMVGGRVVYTSGALVPK